MTSQATKSRVIVVASCLDDPPNNTLAATYDTIRELLAKKDISLEIQPWDAPGLEWSKYGLVILTHVYTYKTKSGAFLKWLDHLQSEGVRVENSQALIRWNMEKSYMADLIQWGVPAIDTVLLKSESFTMSQVASIAQSKGWTSCVIKPSIGSDSDYCYKILIRNGELDLDNEDVDIAGLTGSAPVILVQKFMPGVVSGGELCSVFFDGKFSHSIVRCSPTSGDFRLGASPKTTQQEVPDKALELSKRAMRALPETPLYARIDVLDDGRDEFCVSEVEVLEPTLYLHMHPPSYQRYADAIVARLNQVD